jgi:methylenetetrahydrofolate reductase (NADPH)
MRISDRLRHKRPIFSFEFFPPRTEKGEGVLWRSLEKLASLEPDFVSVTYGAGGSTRARTVEIVGRIKKELGIEPLAHLTCVGSSRDDLSRVLDQLAESGVENVLPLRGDPPKGEENFERPADGFGYANELVEFIRGGWDFCLAGACYPEGHPEADDTATDLAHLKRKVDAGVDFLVSQLFFDNKVFFDFENRARAIGIDVPIVPGIMPITNVKQVDRFTKMCGATIPDPLKKRLAEIEGDPHEVFWAGVSYAAYQCRELLDPPASGPFERPPVGVSGVHFYTLNKSPATRAIFEILQLARTGHA